MKVRIPNNGAGNMQNLMKQAQKMQEDMAEKQAELAEATYTVSAGGGMVTVEINGKHEILALEIKPDIVDPDDIETLSDVLTAAINEAIRKVDETSEAEMSKITSSIGFPGMPGMPGGLF